MKTEVLKLKKIIFIISILIIIAGIIVILTKGFNMGIDYSQSKNVKIYFTETYYNENVNQMLNDVFGNEERKVQDIEYFDNAISITIRTVNDEQISTLKEKVSEEYGIEDIDEHVIINDMPNYKLKDLIKPYIMPFTITTVTIFAYFGIRFRKLGLIKSVLSPLSILAIVEMVYISIIAICRIPFGKLIIPISILIYIASQVFFIWNLNKIESSKGNAKK